MKYTVTLTKEDQRTMLEALISSQEIKERKLVKPDSISSMRKQYLDAAEKFLEPIVIVKQNNNIMTWFIDQMKHSGRFWNTELCVRACAIADRVIANEYDHYKSVQIYEDLFKEA
jgi:aspartate 1-decarboxylase